MARFASGRIADARLERLRSRAALGGGWVDKEGDDGDDDGDIDDYGYMAE